MISHVLNLETPVGASLYDGVQGPFVRLYTQYVATNEDTGEKTTRFDNLDILHEDLGAFIETLQKAKSAIEARAVLEGEVA